jgi:hypothetical protein
VIEQARATERPRLEPAIWLGLCLALLVGLGLRLVNFTASLWLDEFGTLWAVEDRAGEVVRRATEFHGQSPFYYLVVWSVVRLAGESESAMRAVSLVSMMACVLTTALAAGRLNGARAGAWAAGFLWLSYPATVASVDARPYGLAMLCASLAVLGYVRACTTGDLTGRALWVAGGAASVWAHYIQAPFIAGLAVTHLILPPLRTTYRTTRWLTDCALVVVLASPSTLQLLALAQRREALDWQLNVSQVPVLATLLPFLLAVLVPPAPGARERQPVRRAVVLALGLAILVHVMALEIATLLGTSLLAARYLRVVLIPAAILAGVNLSRLTGRDRVLPLVGFALPTALLLGAAYRVTGAFSEAGHQDWRGAVAVLWRELEGDPGTPVLYRSGFVEDDGVPDGSASPARLAPLRSPGRVPPRMELVALTYRWAHPRRARYFDEVVAPRLNVATRFFLLSPPSREPGAGSYPGNVERWIATRWPGRFRVVRLPVARGLVLTRFEAVGDRPAS